MNLKAYPITFPSFIRRNYFLIISNIYYLCLKNSCIYFKKKYLETSTLDNFDESVTGLFSKIYQTNLKTVRKDVLSAFNIEKSHDHLDTKIILRLLPYFYDIN